MNMTWRDEVTLNPILTDVAIFAQVGTAIGLGFGFGLTILCCKLYSIKASKTPPGLSSQILFGLICIHLLCYQTAILISFTPSFRPIGVPCPSTNGDDIQSCFDTLSKRPSLLYWLTEFIITFNQLISDYIVVKRARAILRDNQWVSQTLLVLLVLSSLLGVGYEFSFHAWRGYDERPSHVYAIFCAGMTISVMTLFTNLFATTAVLVKLWMHRDFLKNGLALKHIKPTRAQRILAVLSESGLVFAIFGLFQLAAGIANLYSTQPYINPAAVYVTMVVSNQLLAMASGLYPALVFAIVHLQEMQEQQFSLVELMSLSRENQ